VGEVHRTHESPLDPAGKGINVARLADRLGWPTIAFGFLAGEMGLLVANALAEEGVQSHFLRVPGQTRLNVTVFDQATGSGTSFYEDGPEVSAEALSRLEGVIRPWLLACRVLVLGGSLPPGVPDDTYAHYISLARAAGVKTILDADGEPLRAGVSAGPHLIKPNLAEAQRLLGRPLPDMEAIVLAARELVGMGIETVVISIGARGAVCAQADSAWHILSPPVERRSTVGSGDSMVAGIAVSLARGRDIVEALRVGAAAGAATAAIPGTALGTPADIDRLLSSVEVRPLA
jgi:1-phosphofructokinase